MLSPDILAMMKANTTARAKPQGLFKPSEVVAPPRVSSPASTKKYDTGPLGHLPGTSVQVDLRAGGQGDDARNTPCT